MTQNLHFLHYSIVFTSLFFNVLISACNCRLKKFHAAGTANVNFGTAYIFVKRIIIIDIINEELFAICYSKLDSITILYYFKPITILYYTLSLLLSYITLSLLLSYITLSFDK